MEFLFKLRSVLIVSIFFPLIVIANNGFRVRVLLDECQNDFSWDLTCAKGFALCDPNNPQKKIATPNEKLTVAVKNKNLYINNHKFLKESVLIIPQEGKASFVDSVYQGNFLVVHDGKKYLLINLVDLEAYVFAVLRTESWPGWPLEVNKVFAIASRSYVMYMAMRMEKAKSLYHVKNTNAHQTYKGIHDNPVIAQAIEDTRGMFLADAKKQPILAMFDVCCGGAVSAHIASFNFTDVPYLARKYACKHCKVTPRYSWQAHISMEDLAKRLDSCIPEGKKLHDIKIAKKDKAGLVQELILRMVGGTSCTISGTKFYSLMKPKIKSLSFNIPKKGKFKGIGYGHQIGLCQWGAREMVRDGWDYQRILHFYYPGTIFMKLS